MCPLGPSEPLSGAVQNWYKEKKNKKHGLSRGQSAEKLALD